MPRSEPKEGMTVTNRLLCLGPFAFVLVFAGCDQKKGKDSDQLKGLECAPGQVAKHDGADWTCGTDSVLSETQVEQLVTNGPLDLAQGTTLSGSGIVTDWASIPDVPGDIADGDQDSLGALLCQDGQEAAWDDTGSAWTCP